MVTSWLVGLGHSPDHALAVPPRVYEFRNSLYQNMTVHYQSKLDRTLLGLPAHSTKNTMVDGCRAQLRIIREAVVKSHDTFQLTDWFKGVETRMKYAQSSANPSSDMAEIQIGRAHV